MRLNEEAQTGEERTGGGGKTATSEELRRGPRWNQCSSEYWKTSVRARRVAVGEKDQKTAECEQGTIYDTYVNSENIGDTPCSCRTIAPEKKNNGRATRDVNNWSEGFT